MSDVLRSERQNTRRTGFFCRSAVPAELAPLPNRYGNGLPIRANPVLLCLLLLVCSWSVSAAPPTLQTSSETATAGYFVLDWESAPEGIFELREQATDGAERTLYRGPDTARLISGKPNGVYRYQVRRADESGWSEPTRVTVAHHPLPRALGFFLVGTLVFIATLAVVVIGKRGDRPE